MIILNKAIKLLSIANLSINNKIVRNSLFILFCFINQNNFCMGTSNSESSASLVMSEYASVELQNSLIKHGIFYKQKITTCLNWPDNPVQKMQEEQINNIETVFELVNKSSRDIWVSILNYENFLMPKKLSAKINILDYEFVGEKIANNSCLYIYIWLTEPTNLHVKLSENQNLNADEIKPDIVYEIENETYKKKFIFLSWTNNKLDRQTGGGLLGVNKYLLNPIIETANISEVIKKSYGLQINYKQEENIESKEIKKIKDVRKNDFDVEIKEEDFEKID